MTIFDTLSLITGPPVYRIPWAEMLAVGMPSVNESAVGR